jgi:anion-transporting  ArsA/GET3 family ATPase
MQLVELLQQRLIFVTGKGGVGKTCLSTSLGIVSANMGQKTILVEVDNFHPSLPSIFKKETNYKPVFVQHNLAICNVNWKESLEDWLYRTVKIKRIVNMIQSNKIAMLFLDATPGAREIVILSKIMELLDSFDKVIVDLPASGHALGILRVPKTAIKLMHSGPIHDRAKQILEVFSNKKTSVVLSSLPEEMVVNETLEFRDKIRSEIPQFKNIDIILNRTAVPSLSDDEQQLLLRLKELDINNPLVAEVLQAGLWEQDLEKASKTAIQRIEKHMGCPVFSFSRFGLLGGFSGGIEKVVQQMTAALNRQVQKESAR